jgi:hypothetical protein
MGESPARIATGISTAPISGTAGVGQKKREMTYVTTASTQKATWALRMIGRNGVTIRRSAPMARSAPSMAVTSAMMRKILNRLTAAPDSLKMADSGESSGEHQCGQNVAATAGTTMFLREIIVARITTTPARYTQWAAVSCTAGPSLQMGGQLPEIVADTPAGHGSRSTRSVHSRAARICAQWPGVSGRH